MNVCGASESSFSVRRDHSGQYDELRDTHFAAGFYSEPRCTHGIRHWERLEHSHEQTPAQQLDYALIAVVGHGLEYVEAG